MSGFSLVFFNTPSLSFSICTEIMSNFILVRSTLFWSKHLLSVDKILQGKSYCNSLTDCHKKQDCLLLQDSDELIQWNKPQPLLATIHHCYREQLAISTQRHAELCCVFDCQWVALSEKGQIHKQKLKHLLESISRLDTLHFDDPHFFIQLRNITHKSASVMSNVNRQLQDLIEHQATSLPA